MGALQMHDTMISDALIDFFNNYHMGVTAENVADKWSISRDAQDKFAFDSQMKAAKALKMMENLLMKFALFISSKRKIKKLY